MKKVCLLCVFLLGIAACSSKEKAAENTEATATAPVDAATDTVKKETAKADDGAAGTKASCTLDKDTRVIEVKKTESGGCELFYSKFGEAKSVASSGFGLQYCEEVKDRIQSNLNKAGFACQ